VVLNPAIVRGKGRPKGSKGKKTQGHNITAPRRNPSIFEYIPSSSAPAVLSYPRLATAQSIAVSNLLATQLDHNKDEEEEEEEEEKKKIINTIIPARQLSTTKLGLQRLSKTTDIYLPGTLPPRLYQTNPFARQTDDEI
jgi:hypothetical protein